MVNSTWGNSDMPWLLLGLDHSPARYVGDVLSGPLQRRYLYGKMGLKRHR